MPTFLKDRKLNPWKGQVKRKHVGSESAYFPTKEEAKEWEEMRRGALRRKAKGMKADLSDLQKLTISEMIDRYLKKETVHKASALEETYRLEHFRRWIDPDLTKPQRSLISFHRTDAIEFRDYMELEHTRHGKHIKPGTIRRIMASLKHMWSVAARDWKGYEALKEFGNPWSNVTTRKIPKKRTRRLNDLPDRKNELDRLLAACDGCLASNRIYMRLGIHLAVQLGLRLQEITSLRWSDIDIANSKLVIRQSKTDYRSDTDGRIIALTVPAQCYLLMSILKRAVPEQMPTDDKSRQEAMELWSKALTGNFGTHKQIFPMSKLAFKQCWEDLRVRAGINDKRQDAELGVIESKQGLEFRDLRREAGSRFDEAGLTKAEHDLMMGHDSAEMRSVYVSSTLPRIAKKLDEYWINADIYQDADWNEYVEYIHPFLRKLLSKDDPIAKALSSNVIEFKRKTA